MKELSIEQKAKAYDEAIKRAKSAIKECGNNQGRIAMIESIFPELKESEDDRIRKELIDLVRSRLAGFPQCEKYIAWLEKQGEQKSFDYENANIQQKDFAPQEDAPRYNIGDVLCDKSCTTLDKDAQPNYEIVDIRNGLYICDKGYIPISQQDEYELVAKKIEQKPQRMISAEAKEAMYDKPADSYCQENCKGFQETGKCFADGNCKAKREAEQKPAWSEDDENRINRLIAYFEDKESFTAEDDVVYANWLKSIKDRVQPQNTWKPSDEQMDVLLSEVTAWTKGCSKQIVLESLYQDLNKLKGE